MPRQMDPTVERVPTQLDKQTTLYKGLINQQDLVFDIGANIGHRSAVFAGLCSKVIAVEPNALLVDEMKGRFFHGPRHIELVQKAVGSTAGEATLYYPSDGSLGRHGVGTLSTDFMAAMGPKIFNLDNGWDKQATVQVTTLDKLIEEYGRPSFIKLDIEGYEFPALCGLSDRINALSFEFHPVMFHDLELIIGRLKFLGFREFNYCIAEEFEYKVPDWCSGDDLLYKMKQFAGKIEVYGDVYAR